MASTSFRMEWTEDSVHLKQVVHFSVTEDGRVDFGVTSMPSGEPAWEAEWSMTVEEARQMVKALSALL